ncbi:unnamed protein product [Heligmosomoides polygyrus]|uniref:SAM-dependent methyltransferase n=1 Tax=Heligmosomoides polygyrus TaxID=6339 RepID=A0A183G6V9_HELPZ|nr:unnamed protein product [Heligmosomoides polygyrus]
MTSVMQVSNKRSWEMTKQSSLNLNQWLDRRIPLVIRGQRMNTLLLRKAVAPVRTLLPTIASPPQIVEVVGAADHVFMK